MTAPTRTLFLLRHAQSTPASSGQPGADFKRPLSPIGQRQAAGLLQREGVGDGLPLPQKALVSSALRTQQTLEGALQGVGAVPTEAHQGLYHASANELLATLRQQEEGLHCLVLVGHNPSMHQLAMLLADPADPAARALQGEFAPATLLVLEWPGLEGWDRLPTHAGRVRALVAADLA